MPSLAAGFAAINASAAFYVEASVFCRKRWGLKK
jgi:hypothetical protein